MEERTRATYANVVGSPRVTITFSAPVGQVEWEKLGDFVEGPPRAFAMARKNPRISFSDVSAKPEIIPENEPPARRRMRKNRKKAEKAEE